VFTLSKFPPYSRSAFDKFYCINVYFIIIKSRRMRWAGHVAGMGEKRNAYRLLVGKPEGNRSLGRPRRRWVDNIRMDIWEVGWGDVDWIGLAQDRNRWRALVNSVLNLSVPWNAGNVSSGLTSSGLSSSAQLHTVSYVYFMYFSQDIFFLQILVLTWLHIVTVQKIIIKITDSKKEIIFFLK
jgi:hypothetical protein